MAKKQANILAIDDNEGILNTLKFTLRHEFTSVETIKNPNLIPTRIREKQFDIVLLDMNFKAGINTGNEGLFWLKEILKIDPCVIIIPITAYGDIDLAVRAIKEGAFDFITKPWENSKLIATIHAGLKLRKTNKKVNELSNKQQLLNEDAHRGYTEIIGSSAAMKSVLQMVEKVAPTDANVLITGENGTGKELIAREIHRCSSRASEVFIGVDLGALSGNLFESELFGHNKGAFTDAKTDRVGRFKTASGGTLFLDEIGNLDLALQSKLLTAIQHKKVVPLGSDKEVSADIRLITATNKNLVQMVQDNLFREDLLFRINTIQIELPPLRERDKDVLELAEFYIKKYAKKYNKHAIRLNKKAAEKLLKYNWPGNVRELDHTIEKAIILCNDTELQANDFHFNIQTMAQPDVLNLEEMEKHTVAKALEKHSGNLSQAAGELGVTRKTLYKKIEKYGL